MEIGIKQAKNQLSKLGRRVQDGETVTITKNGKPWFQLVPAESRRKVHPIIPHPSISAEEAIEPLDKEDYPTWI